jgi:hypothetical protein
MRRRAGFTIAVMVLTAAALLVAAPAVGAAPPETFTVVRHNVTTTQFFPDDICGPRAVTETLTNTTEVQHLTAAADGSFHFVDFETGILVADYVDPTIPDQTMRRTETFNINLTPGGTYTETNTFRQADAVLQIRSTYHLTVVDGTPKVEHLVEFVRGCP